MKKLLYCLAAFCLVACDGNDPEDANYVNLGLPSHTKWKIENEQNPDDEYNLFTFSEADSLFRGFIPREDQWQELLDKCTWKWNGSGYTVTGPNGKSITLPAEGYRYSGRRDKVNFVGRAGYYWGDIGKDVHHTSFVNRLYIDSANAYIQPARYRTPTYSLRLVK